MYRAACPGCGAPVDFLSAQSTHAVCGYCQSTVLRRGEVLERIGKMAELFDDHSPLQLGVSGRHQGRPFTLVGCLQYQYAEGRWTEWNAVFDDGSTGCLSEDNGAYVFALPTAVRGELPAPERLTVGQTVPLQLADRLAAKPFSVAAHTQVALASAQGELPRLPGLGQPFAMVELRSADDEVLSLDHGPTLVGQPVAVMLGRAVELDALGLSGLRDDSTKEERARQFDCPNCGAPVEVALVSSQSITCRACRSLIDLSRGTGAELRHAEQEAAAVEPLIALGRSGQLQGQPWQVVGFQRRRGHEPGDDGEAFEWSEYLLYHRQRGFSFLVDAEDGWSLVRPLTGAPQVAADAQSVNLQGKRYALLYSYQAETTYVAGEFYWQVRRGQQTFNRDYALGKQLLSMEQSADEVTWSGGSRLDSAVVAQAFGLKDPARLQRADVAPTSGSRSGCATVILLLVVVLIVLVLAAQCSSCDPETENCSSSASSRSSGGSYGGYSSGGGHK